MIVPNNVHLSWQGFLTDEIRQELQGIEKQIGENYNPSNSEQILRFLTTDLEKVRVIWLGQDVYPMKGVATGRSFEVGTLENWQQPFKQVSMKNIIRLIHKEYNNIQSYNEIKSYEEIKKEIASGTFQLQTPKKWFDALEEQGVLFLNTSFTCETGKPNSHKEIWAHFSKCVLLYISKVNPDIIWFLWGKEAMGNKPFIEQGVFYESRHPMMCSVKYENDFLKFDGFRKTMNIINWLGI
ncbi:uracil-DNA glycosylase [Bacillus sp. AGMB 02131]|uniref:Uracil-DNA glycosylase n=1 Tax=Peribacillus faecalis TaxID=2772559 RepID=A0A927CTR1_9BACI|nr:uracil-DNA glycosylase [Peribacillus faecalis]MBD3107044.1 uracil-DNA glycosylase [Peribacillus faecalis]